MSRMNLTVRGVTFALFPQYDQTDPRGAVGHLHASVAS